MQDESQSLEPKTTNRKTKTNQLLQKEYAIKSGLEEGQKVIYSGNFNLAHDKPVRKTE